MKSVADHLGNRFNSVGAMCEYWGIERCVFDKRVKLGWSLKDSLEKESRGKNTGERIDHLGNEFDSRELMCKHWGIDIDVYRFRRNLGYSVKDALTLDIGCRDHMGKLYINKDAMCKAYGIKAGTFDDRIRKGWKLGEALTTPTGKTGMKTSHGIKCRDHLGNIYNSKTEMCRQYGIPVYVLRSRLNAGWDIKRALTEKVHHEKSRSSEIGY